ncbi:MAG: cytochrome c class [Bacteroidetes bacterium]|jgi:cytochrome c oxidase cbb3-type subunit 3|nr:cytochrome c class [Bacteroidota bacterium]
MLNQVNKNRKLLLLLLVLPLSNYAQDAVVTVHTSYFSNALFNTLLVIIAVLLAVIVTLGQTLKKLADSDYFRNRYQKKEEGSSTGDALKKTSLVLLLLFGYHSYAGNGQPAAADDWLIGGLDMFTFYSLLGIIVAEFAVISILYNIITGLLKTERKQKPAPVQKVKTKTILEKINASVDIEKEQDIMLDHDYDGIRELDNDLPPWWKYGFYLTVAISVIYMINFHVVKTGDLQTEEYEKSMAAAKAEVEAYMKTAAGNVDESTVKQLEGADIEQGKEIFTGNCAACHGKDGQGTVGPNLTDAYWLHGGSMPDIFKSIKYGWVDKGMKSWKEDLSPMQIAQLTSYIRTLAGTNPAGAKAAQGDLYKEESILINDSTKTVSDTLIIKSDSLK